MVFAKKGLKKNAGGFFAGKQQGSFCIPIRWNREVAGRPAQGGFPHRVGIQAIPLGKNSRGIAGAGGGKGAGGQSQKKTRKIFLSPGRSAAVLRGGGPRKFRPPRKGCPKNPGQLPAGPAVSFPPKNSASQQICGTEKKEK